MPAVSTKVMTEAASISSLSNPDVKKVVKLRQRSHRDETGMMIIEGYREIKRALDNKHFPLELFFCEDFFQGKNDSTIIERCHDAGAHILKCTMPVFAKMAYRDRPEGLLAVAPQIHKSIEQLAVSKNPLKIGRAHV